MANLFNTDVYEYEINSPLLIKAVFFIINLLFLGDENMR